MTRKWIYLMCTTLALSACSDNGEKKASLRLQLAQEAYDHGRYEEAKQQIDSIKLLHPKAFEARKAAQTLLMEVETRAQQQTLAYLDSLHQARLEELTTLRKRFVLEKDAEYQQTGHYLAPAQTLEKNLHRSYLRFQVSELGEMSMTSVYCGSRHIHHVAVRVTAPDGSFAETPASKDSNETTVGSEKIEKADYKLGEDGSVIDFLRLNRDKRIRIEFLGDTTYKGILSATDVAAAADVYELAQVLHALRKIEEQQEEARLKIEFIRQKQERRQSPS